MIPLFTSHSSIGRSILTVNKPEKIIQVFKDGKPVIKDGKIVEKSVPIEKPEDIEINSPTSILSIAKSYNLKDIFILENSFSGFVEAYNNCKDNKLNLKFGLKLTICNDINDKSESSFKSESKIIIWMKNSDGYKDLVRLYSKAMTDGFYYIGRLDWKTLLEMFTDNLILCIPPYDSFIHTNLIENGNCIPNFGKLRPSVLFANMELPFDNLIYDAHKNFAKQNNLDLIECNPIYYYKSIDFKPYMVFRAINNRKTFSNPGLDYFCSDRFSFENYWNKIGNKI